MEVGNVDMMMMERDYNCRHKHKQRRVHRDGGQDMRNEIYGAAMPMMATSFSHSLGIISRALGYFAFLTILFAALR
jgi:hypothetical protein